jgi:hypothetical protein
MKDLHLEDRMSEEEVQRVAQWLEPALRDWLSDRLMALDLDPRDAVRVMALLLKGGE